MENHQKEANRNSGKKKKMEMDWTHIMQKAGAIEKTGEEVGRRERGEGQYRMK